jgi:Uma2 family endonuclease
MSLEEYLTRPETDRAEYVDGALVVSPPASLRHQYAARRLGDILNAACPGEWIALEALGWLLVPGGPVRIPDVVVVERDRLRSDDLLLDRPPILAIEVLSPTERPARKLADYFSAGLQHYWTFAVTSGRLTCYRAGPGQLDVIATGSPGHPVTLTEPLDITVDPAGLLP